MKQNCKFIYIPGLWFIQSLESHSLFFCTQNLSFFTPDGMLENIAFITYVNNPHPLLNPSTTITFHPPKYLYYFFYYQERERKKFTYEFWVEAKKKKRNKSQQQFNNGIFQRDFLLVLFLLDLPQVTREHYQLNKKSQLYFLIKYQILLN